MSEYIVCEFKEEMNEVWDRFILQESINGTFLQSRNFLSYHPKERFRDYSLMIYDEKKHLVALCPACLVNDELGREHFIAHKGSTFGGLVINKKNYSPQKVISMLEAVESYLSQKKVCSITHKITPDIFSKEKSDLLQYCLYYKGYEPIEELSLYVDFQDYDENIYKNLSQGKRTDVNNCIKAGMEYRTLTSEAEIEEFYNILCSNLAKFDTTPVHSLDELLEFKNERLKEICEFVGIYYQEKLVAGGMLFHFSNEVVHTQYLCALSEYNRLSPMSFLYYSILVEMKERGYRIVSWGTTTEEQGKYLNVGLAKSKEAYGSKYAVNWTYRKNLF